MSTFVRVKKIDKIYVLAYLPKLTGIGNRLIQRFYNLFTLEQIYYTKLTKKYGGMAEKLDQVYACRKNRIFLFDLTNFIKNPEHEYKAQNLKVGRRHNKVLKIRTKKYKCIAEVYVHKYAVWPKK